MSVHKSLLQGPTKNSPKRGSGHEISNYVMFRKQNQLCSVKGVTLEVYSLNRGPEPKTPSLSPVPTLPVNLPTRASRVRRTKLCYTCGCEMVPDVRYADNCCNCMVSGRDCSECPSAVRVSVCGTFRHHIFRRSANISINCRLVQEF